MKFVILTTFLSFFMITICQKKGGGDQGKDSSQIPIINVHMEEPDRDPIEVKRYEEERRMERERMRDLEFKEEEDKRVFQQIISLQTNQLERLTDIASSTSKMLNNMMINNKKDMPRFLQKKSRSYLKSIKYNKIMDGPLRSEKINTQCTNDCNMG